MSLLTTPLSINPIIDLVEQVGQELIHTYESTELKVYKKKDQTPVTEADLLAHHKICNTLSLLHPHIPLLSEESSNPIDLDLSKSYWAIDPLDGTKEFLNKNGEFTINIALITDGVPIFGLVYAPAINVMYWNDDYNSYKKTCKGIEKLSRRINRFKPSSFDEYVRIGISRSHPSYELDNWLSQYSNHQKHPIGSSLKLCQIADQTIDCYPRFGRICIWDIAAGHAILKAVACDVKKIEAHNNAGSVEYKVLGSLSYAPHNIYNDYFLAY